MPFLYLGQTLPSFKGTKTLGISSFINVGKRGDSAFLSLGQTPPSFKGTKTLGISSFINVGKRGDFMLF